MSEFHELINRLKDPGEEGVPETIYDDLTAAYDATFEGYTANSSEKEAAIQRLNSEVSRLKSANYDLLTQVSTSEPIELEPSRDVDVEHITIDSLFKSR